MRRTFTVFLFVFALLSVAKAQTTVYAITSKGIFGTLNLSSGAFTQLGNSNMTPAGLAGLGANLFLGGDSGNTLYVVNANTGNLAAVGNGSISYDEFGGTATGLYAAGNDNNLYSINSENGASTLVGSLGLNLNGASALSSNGTALYLALDTGSGSVLYSVNTSTGAASKIGSTGVSKIVSMVSANGLLYAINTTGALYTLNTSTGAGTLVANTGTDIYGMASLAAASVPLRLRTVTPCRLVDTRQQNSGKGFTGTMPFNLPQLAQSGGANGGCTSQSAPSSAQAFSLNVTLVPVNNGPVGYLTIWPTGEPQPLVSLMNSDGRTKANAAIVPAGTNGQVNVYVTNTTNVLIDIDAYFDTAGDSQALAFFPLTPCRIVDTRGGKDQGTLQAGQERDYTIPTNCGVPSNAQAYSFNVTVLPAAGGLDYLTVWPKGEPQPVVSTLNASTPDPAVANAAIVPAGADNATAFYPHNNKTDLLLDVDGYFAPASSGTGPLSLNTLTPCRVLDTRGGIGAFNGTIPVGVVGSLCGIPNVAQAFSLNATVVPGNPPAGFLTLWPEGETQPMVSSLNAYDGAVTSNMAIVPAGSGNESINAFADNSGSGTTNLILDIASYFAAIPTMTVLSPSTLPAGTVGDSYNYSLSAGGGVPPYTWTISSGSLPPTLGLSSSGIISGTSTTGGTYNFDVQATDSESPAMASVKAVQITVNASQGTLNVITTSLPDGTVNTPYNVVLNANGGLLPYTWSISSGSLPSGMALNGTTGLISGAPGAAGLFNITLKVTDAQSNTATKSLTLNVNTGNANGSLNGMYAGSFAGFDNGNYFVASFSITADGNGTITTGEVDSDNSSVGVQHAIVTSGTYKVSANGLGQISWTDNMGGNVQLLVATGTAEYMRIIGFNQNGSGGTWGSGSLRQQNPSDFTDAALAGNWAFGYQGFDPSADPLAGDGVFTGTASGSISGSQDINDFGTHTQTTFTGKITSGIDANGRFTLQYQVAGIGTINLAAYVVSADETIAIEIDTKGGHYITNSLRQSGSFGQGSFNGSGVGRGSRIHNADQNQALVLFASSSGNGNITFTEDINSAGGITLNGQASGTYQVAANGRATITFSDGSQEACYLVMTNEAFCINTVPASGGNDKGAEVVFLEPQVVPSGGFTNASFAGEYLGGSLPQYLVATGIYTQVDSNVADGIGSFDSTYSTSGPGGTNLNLTLSGTYVITNSNGAIQISQGGDLVYAGFLISPFKVVYVSAAPGSIPLSILDVTSSAPRRR